MIPMRKGREDPFQLMDLLNDHSSDEDSEASVTEEILIAILLLHAEPLYYEAKLRGRHRNRNRAEKGGRLVRRGT